ncbi:hypothetical protein [Colwellia sp. Bg11-28]|uniref:hypothetical protein n=1 Tax=Colwellia sp. Bg11-28 TaxID=2058305 RepID=UPI000C34A7C9|nr:hypothetical protein [Colwellia sp. Bg11-28]PKH87910.1 hypothetical protein CXF79_14935 [Colwellia sp. Bg11-28]
MKNYINILIIILAALVTTACGSDKTSTQSSDNVTIDKNEDDDIGIEHEVVNLNEDTDKIVRVVNVELEGPVKNSMISVQSLDGFELLQSNSTDGNGRYSIDVEKLSHAIQQESDEIIFVRIVASGGEDTGNKNAIIKGSLSSLISVQQLTTLESHNVNLLTTGVSDVIGKMISVTAKKIEHVSFLMGVEDINGDHKVNIADLHLYKIAIHQSRAENYFRQHLLPNIMQGDNSGVDSFVVQTKQQNPTVLPVIQKDESTLLISFTDVAEGNYIQYGYFTHGELAFTTYFKPDILTLNRDGILYYQECSGISECFKMQRILFDGIDYFHDYLEYETAPQVINDDVISSLENSLLATTQSIANLDEKIKDQEEDLKAIGY